MTNKYNLSGFEYDEETGRPKAAGVYRHADTLRQAERYAKKLLDEYPGLAYVAIHGGTDHLKDVSRLN